MVAVARWAWSVLTHTGAGLMRAYLPRSFNRLLASNSFNNIADGLLKTAAPLLATTLTRDPLLISLLSATVMLPWLLLAMPLGAVVDRFEKRKLLAIANVVRLLAALALASAIGFEWISFPVLLIATFVFGAGEVLYESTLQSLLPELLKPDLRDKGNSRVQVTTVILGEFVGTPLSGLLYAVAIYLPFSFGAVGVFAASLLLVGMPVVNHLGTAESPIRSRKNFRADLKAGFHHLVQDKKLVRLMTLTAIIGLFGSLANSTIVLFLIDFLKAPSAMLGVLFAIPAVGAIAGALLAPKLASRFGRLKMVSFSIIASSALISLQSTATNYWILGLIVALATAFTYISNTLLLSAYQHLIPKAMFGRVNGVRRTIVWGVMPIGAVLGGLLASIDLRLPFVVGGVSAFVAALVGARFLINLENN